MHVVGSLEDARASCANCSYAEPTLRLGTRRTLYGLTGRAITATLATSCAVYPVVLQGLFLQSAAFTMAFRPCEHSMLYMNWGRNRASELELSTSVGEGGGKEHRVGQYFHPS